MDRLEGMPPSASHLDPRLHYRNRSRIIPGAGTNVATFMAYDMEKKLSKDPESFGQGNAIGVAGPESANNAVTGGSLVPLLALGVPGNSTSALFLGAIMIHGMRTGPVFFTEHPDIIYGLFISIIIANIIMAPLGIFVLRYMKTILSVPEELLGGIILAFCVTGVFAIATNPFDVLVLIIFGLIGYFCYKFKIPTAPMIVAMVLGSMTENNLRQALVAQQGILGLPVQAAHHPDRADHCHWKLLLPLYCSQG